MEFAHRLSVSCDLDGVLPAKSCSLGFRIAFGHHWIVIAPNEHLIGVIPPADPRVDYGNFALSRAA